MQNPKIIAVDFDGTITKSDAWPEIGEINEKVVQRLREEKEKGSIIILWTCRHGKQLEEALEFCKKNNIPIDYCNQDASWVKEEFEGCSRKIFAHEYWDGELPPLTTLTSCLKWGFQRSLTALSNPYSLRRVHFAARA